MEARRMRRGRLRRGRDLDRGGKTSRGRRNTRPRDQASRGKAVGERGERVGVK